MHERVRQGMNQCRTHSQARPDWGRALRHLRLPSQVGKSTPESIPRNDFRSFITREILPRRRRPSLCAQLSSKGLRGVTCSSHQRRGIVRETHDRLYAAASVGSKENAPARSFASQRVIDARDRGFGPKKKLFLPRKFDSLGSARV